MDAIVRNDLAAGITPVILIDSVPYWASADPAKYTDSNGEQHWNWYYRPRNYEDYGRFVRFVVGRYSKLGVHAYELWNEPNTNFSWPSGPDPEAYAEMLKVGHQAAHAADRRATVLLAGLSPEKGLYRYLDRLYAAGARNYFDAVGLHEYPTADPARCWSDDGRDNSPSAFCSIASVYKRMKENGDERKQIWLTEFGWSSCNDPAPVTPCVSEQQQAEYLSAAFRLLDCRYPYVAVATWFSLRDQPGLARYGDWFTKFGIVRSDFAAKPAYHAFKSYATGSSTSPAGRCERSSRCEAALEDTVRAGVRTLRRRSRRVLLKTRGFRLRGFRAACPGDARVLIRVPASRAPAARRRKQVVLGIGRTRLMRAGRAGIRVRLTSGGIRVLRRRGRLRVLLRVSFTDDEGEQSGVVRKVTLRRML